MHAAGLPQRKLAGLAQHRPGSPRAHRHRSPDPKCAGAPPARDGVNRVEPQPPLPARTRGRTRARYLRRTRFRAAPARQAGAGVVLGLDRCQGDRPGSSRAPGARTTGRTDSADGHRRAGLRVGGQPQTNVRIRRRCHHVVVMASRSSSLHALQAAGECAADDPHRLPTPPSTAHRAAVIGTHRGVCVGRPAAASSAAEHGTPMTDATLSPTR